MSGSSHVSATIMVMSVIVIISIYTGATVCQVAQSLQDHLVDLDDLPGPCDG